MGGNVLEISGGGRRVAVELLNDPGPGRKGHTLARLAEGYELTFEAVGENFGKGQE